jgi:PhnB protein
MTFYQACLGGKLILQTVGESPLGKQMPKQMRDCILHATLTKEALVLKGTDMVPQTGLVKGNAVSLSLECSDEEEIKILYTKLSAKGKADHPPEATFWGALFGTLIDKYGNQWLLNCSKN